MWHSKIGFLPFLDNEILSTALQEKSPFLKASVRHYKCKQWRFTPLIFTTTGVMSHECSIFHKSLAEKISKKRGDGYDEVVRYLRVKFSFLALKATLLCLRGSRGRKGTNLGVHNEDFGLALNELGMWIYLVNLVVILWYCSAIYNFLTYVYSYAVF